MTFEKVCKITDIPDDGVIGVEVEETPVALVRRGAEVYALHDVCSHAEVRLSEGEVYDGTLECWLHGSCFDLRSGKPTGPPASKPVPVYQVKIDGDDVLVSLSKES
ncbi:Rieske (2Fe-2S) protein [Streptosporangium saharense]|uniref:3-phenylpropionate/trans-cinnamate dioxygenase ferredoxin subunit n=1 Tax=Streptosporangium saharense TaxID=1706840 RepID=A0A7W7QUK2_9ACTN|nr:non-heme iron oxygenase ferredoxin subunit [Streptosporangium saharense]MBB4919496.1 3-phenylpropionate/trans-cinnamate dioxygenase ferredoxin subunit [Streptosporangium saharense]